MIVGDSGLISAFDGLSALFPSGLQVPGEKLSDQKVNRFFEGTKRCSQSEWSGIVMTTGQRSTLTGQMLGC